MEFFKICTLGAFIAMGPAMATAGSLGDSGAERVVIAPVGADDDVAMGSLNPLYVAGGLAVLAAIAIAANQDDDSSTSSTN